VAAVVMTESSFDEHAYRYEPGFWRRYLKNNPRWNAWEPERVSASYGLMQIMYTTAVDLGYSGDPEGLYDPVMNLRWGCRCLKSLLNWAHGDVNSALAAYNGGKRGNEPGTVPLRNRDYVTRVQTNLKWIQDHDQEDATDS